jgi:hypothetical protein
MTETEQKTKELIEKVGGIENFRIISAYVVETKALEGVKNLTEEEGRCQNRPFCRKMEIEGLHDLLKKDPSIEQEIMEYVFG